jgi:hypothetical protein
MQDHRRCPRWQINWQAKVRISDKESLTDCHINDINFKGLKLTLAEKLTPDTFVKLSLILSSDFVLNVEAWVAWHKTIDGYNLYGLYFTKIKDLDKEKIYQFMRGYFPEKINQQWWKDLSAEKGGEEMQDRRIFARFSTEFPLRFLDLNRGKEGQAQTQDISAKGIGFLTNEELSTHTPLEMWLEIPDKGEPLYTRGEVAWSKSQGADEYRVGVNLERADLMGMSRVLRTM